MEKQNGTAGPAPRCCLRSRRNGKVQVLTNGTDLGEQRQEGAQNEGWRTRIIHTSIQQRVPRFSSGPVTCQA